MSKLILRNTLPPLDASIITEFEHSIKCNLPIEYTDFLKRNNGGNPNLRELEGFYIEGFYGITRKPYPLNAYGAIERIALPSGFIPFARSGTGEMCLEMGSCRILFREDQEDDGDIAPLAFVAGGVAEFLEKMAGEPEFLTGDSEVAKIGHWRDVDILDSYLNSGGDIDFQDAEGNCIVSAAVYAGDIEFVKECVKRGASLRQRELIHGAVFTTNCELLEYLLEQGVDPNEPDSHGRPPLDVVLYPTGSAVKILIERGGKSTR